MYTLNVLWSLFLSLSRPTLYVKAWGVKQSSTKDQPHQHESRNPSLSEVFFTPFLGSEFVQFFQPKLLWNRSTKFNNREKATNYLPLGSLSSSSPFSYLKIYGHDECTHDWYLTSSKEKLVISYKCHIIAVLIPLMGTLLIWLIKWCYCCSVSANPVYMSVGKSQQTSNDVGYK